MYKLCIYIPESHLQTVKQALFKAGAGNIGHYDQCCWQVLGTGQFRPLQGHQAHIGVTNQLEQIAEYRVEMICPVDKLSVVIKALYHSHPYEEPAFDVTAIIDTHQYSR